MPGGGLSRAGRWPDLCARHDDYGGSIMTALEKIGSPPSRLSGTALYDWDYLVQEDRAHRLIYTDPAIFEAEMTHIFGGTWTYLAHESEIPNDNDFITRRMGLAAADHRARRRRQDPRALQPLHPSRHDAVPLGQGQRKSFQCPITAGIFSTPAGCAACRGRTAMPTTCAIRNTISRRCRAWTPIAASSSARSIWTRCR